MPQLEICAGTPQSVIAAVRGGADRVELCSALSEGGVTPSAAFTSFAAERIRTHVLIRPRSGDFLYGDAEKQVMLRDIACARQAGAKGIAIGALTARGDVDMDFMEKAMLAAGDMSVTFHRAFDMVRDADRALEDIILLGCHRILTSGCAPTAEQGLPRLRELVERAAGRIVIMPASGVNPENARTILASTGAREIHASASHLVRSAMEWQGASAKMGAPSQDEFSWKETSEHNVRLVREAIDGVD